MEERVAILVQLTGVESLTIGRLDGDTCGDGPWVISPGVEYIR